MFDVDKVKADFPLLAQKTGDGKRLVYLDSAASSQKPQQVLPGKEQQIAPVGQQYSMPVFVLHVWKFGPHTQLQVSRSTS